MFSWMIKMLEAVGLKESNTRKMQREVSELDQLAKKYAKDIGRYFEELKGIERDMSVCKVKYKTATEIEKAQLKMEMGALFDEKDRLENLCQKIKIEQRNVTSLRHAKEVVLKGEEFTTSEMSFDAAGIALERQTEEEVKKQSAAEGLSNVVDANKEINKGSLNISRVDSFFDEDTENQETEAGLMSHNSDEMSVSVVEESEKETVLN